MREKSDRKEEIVTVASELFMKKGYDETSMADILREVDIAKGTLYYHFPSKEAILDAMIERVNQQIFSRAEQIAGQKEIPLKERLIQTVLALRVENEKGIIKEEIHKPQNALLHQKSQILCFQWMTNLLAGLFEEGIRNGEFHIRYPREAAKMISLFGMFAFDEEYLPREVDRMGDVIAGFIDQAERLLGVQEGELKPYFMKMFE